MRPKPIRGHRDQVIKETPAEPGRRKSADVLSPPCRNAGSQHGTTMKVFERGLSAAFRWTISVGRKVQLRSALFVQPFCGIRDAQPLGTHGAHVNRFVALEGAHVN